MSTTSFVAQFEADCDPATAWPRVRFNFANGWSAIIFIRTHDNETTAQFATLACSPTGQWESGKIALGPILASADEALAWIDAVRQRPSLQDADGSEAA